MTEYIKNQLIKLCDNPEWFNDMLNTWDFKPERESQAIKEYLSHVLLNGKLENTHIERIEIFATMTDNTDTYDFATFDKEATNGEPPYPVIEIHRKGLAYFLNEDQGYKSGISMYGHYIACKCLDISSEEEYMNQYTDIRILTNELEPC